MSWSSIYEFALTGESAVLDSVKDFLAGLPRNEKGNGVHLNDVRRALYGRRMQEENARGICTGPGYVYDPETKDDGSLRIVVEAFDNLLEWRKFVRALRKKCGRFRHAVLIDDTDLLHGSVPFTNDRTGRFFPHFMLVEGTPDELDRFPIIYTNTVKKTEVANTRALLKELRGRGFRFRSFKELASTCPNLAIKNADGETAVGIWAIESPGQDIPDRDFA